MLSAIPASRWCSGIVTGTSPPPAIRRSNSPSGEFIAFLDNDDMLTEQACFGSLRRLRNIPEVGLIYSDEDKSTSRLTRSDPISNLTGTPICFFPTT